jgi:hypothetical protein
MLLFSLNFKNYFLFLLISQVGKQMLLGTLEDVFKSEMLYLLSRLVSKSIILFRNQVGQAMSAVPATVFPYHCVHVATCNNRIFAYI